MMAPDPPIRGRNRQTTTKVGGGRQASVGNRTVMTTGDNVSVQLMSEQGDGQQWQRGW